MAVTLTVNGQNYPFPELNDTNWAQNVTDWATAVTQGMLQKAGGLFALQAELDFGQNYGIKSLYYKTRTSNIASAGQFRLARADVVSWRNNANGADLNLSVDTSNELNWAGNPLPQEKYTAATSDTLDMDITDYVITGEIVAGSILNTHIGASAAIALSKLAALTASRALVSDGSGVVSVSAVTATELGYVSGVTSAIQTQLGTKLTDPMTTNADLITRAAGVPARIPAGTNGDVLTMVASAPTWQAPAGAPAVVVPMSYPHPGVNNTLILVDTSAARTIELPAPSNGTRLIVKDAVGLAASNNITLARDGSEKIEGVAADKVLQTDWGAWTFVSDGTDWYMI